MRAPCCRHVLQCGPVSRTGTWSRTTQHCFPSWPQSSHLFLIAALPEAIRIRPPPERTFPLQLQTQPHTGYPVALINHIKMDCSGSWRCRGACGRVCCPGGCLRACVCVHAQCHMLKVFHMRRPNSLFGSLSDIWPRYFIRHLLLSDSESDIHLICAASQSYMQSDSLDHCHALWRALLSQGCYEVSGWTWLVNPLWTKIGNGGRCNHAVTENDVAF